jgi:two-component system, LytTR family, sensor kinase
MSNVHDEARAWVRRKRTFYRILGVYLVLCVVWFVIDMLNGPGDLWFYWPMLGAGLIVGVIAAVMFGIDGVFGAAWERREVDKYVERHDK